MRQFTRERITARLDALRPGGELADLFNELLEMVGDLETRIEELESDLFAAENPDDEPDAPGGRAEGPPAGMAAMP